jgi:hypothetical protein
MSVNSLGGRRRVLRAYFGLLNGRFNGRCSVRVNANEFTLTALVFKLDYAVNQSEKRVVLAPADILSGLPFRATLPSKDVSPKNLLTAKFLKAQPLRV